MKAFLAKVPWRRYFCVIARHDLLSHPEAAKYYQALLAVGVKYPSCVRGFRSITFIQDSLPRIFTQIWAHIQDPDTPDYLKEYIVLVYNRIISLQGCCIYFWRMVSCKSDLSEITCFRGTPVRRTSTMAILTSSSLIREWCSSGYRSTCRRCASTFQLQLVIFNFPLET